MFFVPLAQTVNYANEMMKRVETASHYVGGLLLVTNASPGALEPQVARALAEADPNLAVISMRTLQQQVERTFDQQRAVASLAGLFGVDRAGAGGDRPLRRDGVLGGAPHERDRRPHGARRRSPARDRTGAGRRVPARRRRPACSACRFAVGAGYLLSSQLYGVTFWDPVALAIAAGSLAVAAFIASIVPATRAAAIAPMKALRME